MGNEIQINLRIQNNTATEQDINILGSVTPPTFANTTTTVYSFDLSAENWLLVTFVQINYSTILNPFPAFNSLTAPLTNLTIHGVVDALNTLNVGRFYFVGTTIYVDSDFYQYNALALA